MKYCVSCKLFECFSEQRKTFYEGKDGQCNLHKEQPRLVNNKFDKKDCAFYKYLDYVAEKIQNKGW